jgi:branched-chain amino acid transport system ATP-binding protein
MLELKDLAVNYGSITALHDVSLTVAKGDIVTLIGANGAGKSTTLRTVSGLLKTRQGRRSAICRLIGSSNAVFHKCRKVA